MIKSITPGRVLAAVLLLTGGLYLSLTFAPPLNWDDDSNIFANPYFRAGWWATFWSSEYFGLYVPVTSTVWHALFDLGGGAAWPFRLLNAGLHVTNTYLVYLGLRALGRRGAWGSPWSAVLGAAVFALHPAQTATVAWLSGGRDLLAAGFGLGALLWFFRGRGRFDRALATLAFAAATLSKPSAVILPLVAWSLAPVAAPHEPRSRGSGWLAVWLGLAALVTWWTLGAQREHLPVIAGWRRPWLMGDAYWFYQTHLVNTFDLSANYARTPDVVFARPLTLLGAIGGWALLGLGLGARRARAYRPFVAAWALVLLPVSGIVSFGYQQTSGVADHYAYLAMAFVAAGAARLASTRRPRTVVISALVIGLTWVIGDVRRLGAWRSNDAFFSDMAKGAPTAYATAIGMSSVACAERGDFGSGVAWTDVALRARPLDIRALANQAYCLLHAREFTRVNELDFYFDRLDQEKLARVEPTGYSSFLASVGSAKIELGQLRDGYQFLCEARRILPGEPVHQRNLDLAGAILRRQKLTPSCAPEDAESDEDDD